MPAHAAKPVLGVGEIRLAAVHDAVPVAAARRVDVLADGMALVEEIVVEPQAGQASGGHVLVLNLFRGKRTFYRQGSEPRSNGFLGLAGTQRIQPALGEHGVDVW